MGILTIEGVVENGQIRLSGNLNLAEHTRVYVVVPEMAAVPPAHIASPRLAHPEQAVDFVKQIVEVSAHAGI